MNNDEVVTCVTKLKCLKGRYRNAWNEEAQEKKNIQ